MPSHALSRQRVDELSAALPSAVDHLHRRRAAQVPADHVEDYVALGWLKWNGGLLRLTPAGEAVYRKAMELVAA